jgi:hypothetical protein
MRREQSGSRVERWGIFEVALRWPRGGNPFEEVRLSARFEQEAGEGAGEGGSGPAVSVSGFYDGDGVYRIRFMPEHEGRWRYRSSSNVPELDGKTGELLCTPASPGNHGPVRVAGRHHFSYADGTPFFVLGTTAYVWSYRPEEIRRQTLESFSRNGFNKIRMLFLPKHYGDGKNVDISYDPPALPFEGKPGKLDFRRFNVEYFRSFEERLRELQQRGIEADVILFHFYDFGHWGVDVGMSREDDLFFVRYLLARLAAFRNVWWSLANEYELLVTEGGQLRSVLDRKDWDALGRLLCEEDPYGHLRSVHNFPFGVIFPDHPWLTHVSYQHPNTYSLLLELKRRYGKPVIDDEYQYEGNLPTDWASCTPELELTRHWAAVMAGGYATHGEAYKIEDNPRDIFWSYGGKMVGGSAPRLGFMRRLLESLPYQQMEPDVARSEGRDMFCLRKGEELYLYFKTPAFKDGGRVWIGPASGQGAEYEVEVWDAWNCWLHKRLTVKPGMNLLDVPPWAAIKVTRRQPGPR